MKSLSLWILGFSLLLCFSVGVAVSVGSIAIPLSAVAQSFLYHLHLVETPPEATLDAIIWSLRLPRVILALLVGGGLSIIGVAMQALVRNPLAEPYILGISSGASAGASLFYLGFLPPLISRALSLPLSAFIGALLAISVVYLVARTESTVSIARLLLAGVAMAAFMAAITSFITLMSPDPNRLRAVLFWLIGSLYGTRWEMLPLPAFVTILGLMVMMGLSRPLDALLLGEEPAHGLGVPVETVKKILVLLAALVTGTLVSASGAIGFVGLIIPHAVRSMVGVSHRKVVFLSFLVGGLFLLWADLGARALLPSQDFPVGIITALCGVPFFLILLRRSPYQFG